MISSRFFFFWLFSPLENNVREFLSFCTPNFNCTCTQKYSQSRKRVICYIYDVVLLGEGNSDPLQYSCLENPMDGGAWWAAVHGVAKSLARLSDFTFTLHFHALEKEMATHSSILAQRIPGTGEPSGLPSRGSHRVGHDRSDLAAAAAAVFIVSTNHLGGC